MLYDRIKWHYDKAIPWQDEDAVRAYLPTLPRRLVADAATTFRYDLTDHAEFQRPDPQWTPPPGLRGMVVRAGDGVYREPSFATDFRIMDDLLQQGHLDYVMWYLLPNPNVSNQRMVDMVAGQIKDSGVTWGRPGHGFSIDDEPTPYHGQVTGQTMIDLRNQLQDIYGREELHYVGLYNGNYGFIENQGWQLWAPWPTGNGPLPSWTTNLVMQQWGVAAAGEVPGFPSRPVDVDHIWDQATLDALTGRTPTDEWETFFVANQDTMNALAQFLSLHGMGGQYDLRDTYNNAAANHALLAPADLPALQYIRNNYNAVHGAGDGPDGWLSATLGALQKSVDGLATDGVDVDKLAELLAPKLGVDPKAIAQAVAEVLGERLVTGGTPGGAS